MKADYINNHNARGAIIWEITGDYIETSLGSGIIAGTPLLDTMNYVFCHSSVTSIKEYTANEIELYPNPASNFITILIKNNNAYEYISIFDSKGALILKQKVQNGSNEIDSKDFLSGIYFIQLTGNNNSCHKKIMVSN
jgi:hypothetical protein